MGGRTRPHCTGMDVQEGEDPSGSPGHGNRTARSTPVQQLYCDDVPRSGAACLPLTSYLGPATMQGARAS